MNNNHSHNKKKQKKNHNKSHSSSSIPSTSSISLNSSSSSSSSSTDTSILQKLKIGPTNLAQAKEWYIHSQPWTGTSHFEKQGAINMKADRFETILVPYKFTIRGDQECPEPIDELQEEFKPVHPKHY